MLSYLMLHSVCLFSVLFAFYCYRCILAVSWSISGHAVLCCDRPCSVITETEYFHRKMNSLKRGTFYRISHDDCYTDEYTALRAERTVGEEKYDFFEQNCEHTVVWCKTGLHSSEQVTSWRPH